MELPDWLLDAAPFLGVIGALVALIFGAQWAQRRRKPPTVTYLPPRPGVTPPVDDLARRLDEIPEGQPAPEPTDPEGLSGDEVDEILTGNRNRTRTP